jgi:hypothetical protein
MPARHRPETESDTVGARPAYAARMSRRTVPLSIVLPAVLALSALLAACGVSGGDDGSAGGDGAERTTVEEGSGSAAPEEEPDGQTTAVPEETTVPDETTVPEEGPSSDAEGCDALRAIADYDIEAGELIESAPWPEVQAFFVDSLPDVLAAYDDAIVAVPAQADTLTTLRDFTATTGDVAAEASSVEDLGLALLDLPGITESGQAALELNDYATETCGFSTGNN